MRKKEQEDYGGKEYLNMNLNNYAYLNNSQGGHFIAAFELV